MASGAPQGDFKLVLTGLNAANQAAIVAELMDAFQLDGKLAGGIAQSAAQGTPVVLLDGLSRAQAANVRTYLARLLKLGAQMSLTAEAVGQAKRIPWPAPPPVTRRPASVFACPNCGERFIVQRWQPAPVAPPPPAVPAPPPPPAPAPPPAPPAAPAPEEVIPEALAVEPEPPEAEGVVAEAVEPVEAEELPMAAVELPEAEELPVAEALPAEALPAEALPAEPLPAEVLPAEPLPPPAAQPAPAPAPAAQPAPQPAAAKPKPAPAKPAPAAQPAGAKAPAGPRYDVSVARVADSKRGRLAELLIERQGLSPEEAESRVGRTVVLVCKGGTSAEADDWRKALIGIGLKPRIRKK